MTFHAHAFPITLSKPTDAMVLAMRIAVAKETRRDFRRRLAGGRTAGVEELTILQKFSFDWSAAARASRMTRAIPIPLVQWCMMAETRANNDGYPEAPDDSVGTMNKDTLDALPGNVFVIKAGGVNATGVSENAIPMHEFVELRMVQVQDGSYIAVIITNNDQGQREAAPAPTSGELQDA